MKKLIILSMMLLLTAATILTGCRPKDTMLPKDSSTIIGIDYKEVQNQKGSGKGKYMGETLINLTYNEKWFAWN